MDDAMDEFQEADVLWPDATTGDELVVVVSFAATGMVVEEPYGAAASSSVSGFDSFEGLVFLPGAAGPSSSAGTSPDTEDGGDEDEWQEADVLWPDTVGVVPRGGGGGGGGGGVGVGLPLPFPGRHVSSPAAGRRERDRWRPAASSSPIDIPTNVVAARRRFY